MADLTVTYILWLFGGILGLHHVYLNRPRHCFIWFVTWGGMALGWITEVFQIKEYVEEANNSYEFKKRLKEFKKANPRPEITVGFLGFSMLIGHQLANVAVNAVPDTYITETVYGPYLAHGLAALGSTVGVYLVANMGQQKGPFWIPFLAALCTSPSSYFLSHNRAVINVICVMAAAWTCSEFAEWDEKKKPKTTVDYVKIWGTLILGLIVYGSLWTSNIYHNHRVSTLNGTRIPLREAAANFAKTQPWDDASEAMWDILPCLKMYPYDVCMNTFISRVTELSDPGKDIWAMEVLGLEKVPNQKEITSHCRKMSKKFHPDRVRNKDKEKQEEAEKRFLDIQKACSTLSKIKMNRERKSTWTENEQQNTVRDYDDVFDKDNSDSLDDDDLVDNDLENIDGEGLADKGNGHIDNEDLDDNGQGHIDDEDVDDNVQGNERENDDLEIHTSDSYTEEEIVEVNIESEEETFNENSCSADRCQMEDN